MQPFSGKKVPEINLDNIPEILFGNYRIIYKIVIENQIDIITIHNRKRLFENNDFLKQF
jgi:toxin ParE1/3/4